LTNHISETEQWGITLPIVALTYNKTASLWYL